MDRNLLEIAFSQTTEYNEIASRSFLKAISWRLIGSITVVIISYLYTGAIDLSLSIGFIDIFSNIFLYFLHERTWNFFDWGQSKKNHKYTRDSTNRSIIKALTWRITASSYLVAVIYLLGEELNTSLVIAITDALVNIVEYYFHERAWNRVEWGTETRQVGDNN